MAKTVKKPQRQSRAKKTPLKSRAKKPNKTKDQNKATGRSVENNNDEEAEDVEDQALKDDDAEDYMAVDDDDEPLEIDQDIADDGENKEDEEDSEASDNDNNDNKDSDDDNVEIEESNGLEEEPVVLTRQDIMTNQLALNHRLTRPTPDSPTLESLPESALLVYAVNGLANWGFGFTKAIKGRYPQAFKAYKEHCNSFKLDAKSYPQNKYSGKCLVIPPDARNPGDKPGKDTEDIIKRQTVQALEDFRKKLAEGSDGLRSHPLWTPSGQHMQVVCPCFNAGAFKIS
ncbi:hypothetical protein F5B21DRAFT_510120 [Xylaria acuta]|nr:hypothetical protein F5B21DRAFT_510120 [Xylaria acuta]